MLELLNMVVKLPKMVEVFPVGTFTDKVFARAVVVSDRYVLTYGGWNGSANTNFLNRYDLTYNQMTEQTVSNADTRHSYGAVVNSANNGVSIIYSAGPINRNSYLNLPMGSVNVAPVSLSASGVDPRQEPAIARIGQYAYLFGGWKQDDTILNDTVRWTIDTTTMLKLTPANPPPKRRASASCAHNNKMYVFGGTDAPSSSVSMSDFWCYDPAANTWTKLADAPVGLRVASMTSHKGHIYVYGGMNVSTQTANLLRYDIATNQWHRLALVDGVPMHGHSLVSVGGRLFTFWGSVQGIIGKRIFEIQNV